MEVAEETAHLPYQHAASSAAAGVDGGVGSTQQGAAAAAGVDGGAGSTQQGAAGGAGSTQTEGGGGDCSTQTEVEHQCLEAQNGQSYPSAMLQLVRNACTNLFVGGLSYDTNETVLRDSFMQYGEIIEVRVICHHVTGKSRGFGFVKFTSEDGAASALKEMDGQVLDGRNIRVHQAHKQ
uniref:RRM domain-containing protein n=1 Tax=Chenopodium quinoa TaxID=63459 RepID=A0A803LCM5_CHEQI